MDRVFLNMARIIVLVVFVSVFGVLMQWAFHPERRPDVEAIARARNEAARAAQAAANPTATPSATPTPEPTPEGPNPNDLIALGRSPQDIKVQALRAGASNAQFDKAVSALERMGYTVITSSSKRTVKSTTIYTTKPETQADAEALRARDPRFAEIEENGGLKAEVDLHVLIGDDF
ncbi:LytR C-terminal domain-containing protein [Stomatohabitans albus]|uniref:LytR C-terminal domain-containing protein n=1 Tax=Stomatohabitans albus TaxID=3110766 RepID=UPI00300C4BA2